MNKIPKKKKAYQKLYRKQRTISLIYILNTILFAILAMRGINVDIFINPVFASTEFQEEANQPDITSEVIEENKPAYTITLEERELLAKLLYCEARGESYDCQKAVISVVMNRVRSSEFPNTINSVIYQKNQFEPVALGLLDKAQPSKTQYDAIDEVIQYGLTVPSWVCFFRASYHFNWQGYDPYCSIDHTYFGGYER